MTEPTDAEIIALLGDRKPDCYGIRQITDDEGIEEWEDIRTSPDVAREEANDMMATGRGEIYEVVPLWTTPQPTQPQAGVVPLTDIRKVALDLYTPPFRHEYGYIRDANHQMVADDASSEATGLIAARIRGWGRIQYMDKPEMGPNALQDEVAEMVAEALNAYWAAHGIKGGQHGADN